MALPCEGAERLGLCEPQPDKLSIHCKVLLLKRIKPFLERKSFDDLSTTLLTEVVDEQVSLTKKGNLSPNDQADLRGPQVLPAMVR